MSVMLTFQEMIERLSKFWEKQGCIIQQGYDLEMGAGTFNPASFLRCLGPEPYSTAFVELCRRPTDGRYGENPNRFQLFHQYQVILKPSPTNVQQTYLKSLKALGLKLEEHDIRFVHDDWEGPTLGAWGLGWEVWSDGMEITQFTYFQAMGSLSLHPISVELTYGLERLAMYIQKVDSFLDLKWNDTLTFRELSLQNEIEWSKYNFEEANVSMWKTHFEDYEREAKTLIDKKLPLPALDFVLKSSHAFNLLDARGVISTTERTGYITRIRNLARKLAQTYLESREELGFPLLTDEKPKLPKAPTPKKRRFNPEHHENFLLEIYSEELPATFVPIGIVSLHEKIEHLLQTHHVGYRNIKTYATPRRLSIIVEGLAEGSESQLIERKGPPVHVAFTKEGALTPQGKGFFANLSLKETTLDRLPKELSTREIKGQLYLYANIKKAGTSTITLLQEHLPGLILDLSFPKKMRWNSFDITYPRPIQSITALYGKTIIPFTLGPIRSSRTTYGHAQLRPQKISLTHVNDYLSSLRAHNVEPDMQKRTHSILEQLSTFEKKLGVCTVMKEEVLEQVLYMSEWPMLTLASFNHAYLHAPAEILISEMVEHQKYFPLAKTDGTLINEFVITADNTPNDTIRSGNKKVVSARLADGVFLYDQEKVIPLEQFNEKLKTVTFHKDLGSMHDKMFRLTHQVKVLHKHLPIAPLEQLTRAAHLCKADLASTLVSEFPTLQGTIGKHFALEQNEDPTVALAIEEHWMPRSEDAPLPTSPTGTLLSLANKCDNLLAYFSVGLKPTSSADPFALRRQAIAILKILLTGQHQIDLPSLFTDLSANFHTTTPIDDVLTYITTRAKSLFVDQGFPKDEVEASLYGQLTDPYDQYCRLSALHNFRKNPLFPKLHEVYKRAKGQIEGTEKMPLNKELLKEPAEQELLKGLSLLETKWETLLQNRDYEQAFNLMAELQPALSHLFDTVLILSEDKALRQCRTALLQEVFSYFATLLDFSLISSG